MAEDGLREMSDRKISRRALLGSGAALWLAGCGHADRRDHGAASSTAPMATTPTTGSARAATSSAAFRALEKDFDARLGVWARDTATGSVVAYNADDRFAFCSTHKAFSAAAVLKAHSLPELETLVRYGTADLVAYSPITAQHVGGGMSLRNVCAAAIQYSDNTAANLLLRELGGPARLQAFLRSLGDTVSDCSRIEPALNTAVPGDVRDTTTPRVWGEDLQKVTLGNVLPEDKRATLVEWLVGNVTGAGLIRSAVPVGWKVGDRTGNGGYGTRNDIAVVWPSTAAPIVMTVMSSRPKKTDTVDDRLVAKAAAIALRATRQGGNS